jgi:hypothetical protein
MRFEHEGLAFNLLDAPATGISAHWDFSEDNYGTLSAVDSVVVLDAAPNGGPCRPPHPPDLARRARESPPVDRLANNFEQREVAHTVFAAGSINLSHSPEHAR